MKQGQDRPKGAKRVGPAAGGTFLLISPNWQSHTRLQINLDKMIKTFKAQLGINEISNDVYTAVEPSDPEDTEKSDRSDSISGNEWKSKNEPEDAEDKEGSWMDEEPSTVKQNKTQIVKPSGN